jgi:hypothetical protein
MRLVAIVAASLAWAAAPAFGETDFREPGKNASYCSPTGDICYGIGRSPGVVFHLTTYARYFPRYTICVRSPHGSKTCRTMPVRRQGSFWGSKRSWPRNFGDSRPGVYRVTWSQSGRALGPTLRFTQR